MKPTAAAEVAASAWNEWGIPSLVLLSFTLQVTLALDIGGVPPAHQLRRPQVLCLVSVHDGRRDGHICPRLLGHMSVTSRSPEHQLMAFWAPFLIRCPPWWAGQHHCLRHPSRTTACGCATSSCRWLQLVTSSMGRPSPSIAAAAAACWVGPPFSCSRWVLPSSMGRECGR
ncbi:hypothetical protein BS78_K287100 [Paspalum vaginatum]|uniref:Uncharacterized protein n=1 Tax=Paspalum vaginatum TaxID=158149 RepID=A0A9W7XDZ5_9POAL|nr:hypothetical protein BS78_K287100 [Paspalum vaginatum]